MFCVCLCGSKTTDLALWMTSVDDALAGGKKRASDHVLPSLVNGVSEQTAPNQLQNGDDERTLDRMGAKQRKVSCRGMRGLRL